MAHNLADFPEEVRQLIAPFLADDPAVLDAIGVAIAERRDEAKSARTSSGVETIWKECEEAYIGVDDANRHEFQDAKWSKPLSMDGPVTTGSSPSRNNHKSTAFVRVTARYVDAGAAKLGEILLPADDKAFSFSETPVPELIKAKEDKTQIVDPVLGPMFRAARPGEPQLAAAGAPPVAAAPVAPAPAPTAGTSPLGPVAPVAAPAAGGMPSSPPAGAPATPPQVPLTVADAAEENIEMQRKKAKAAETRIYDWMVECQYPAEMRKVIFDASRLGVGVLKAPFPQNKKDIALKTGKDGAATDTIELQIDERIIPAAGWVDPWNIFPDGSCGENVHNGDFIFERDYMTARQVRDLKKLPGYIGKQIDRVLIEGPNKFRKEDDSGASGNPGASKEKDRFEIWYYYGSLKRDEMDCICKAALPPESKYQSQIAPEQKEVFVIVTLINDCVVRATINPLDSGSFPYHSVPWQRRSGHWAGIGVAEQVKTPQKMLNAATRAMLNNAGKSAGSQIVLDRGSIVPADGDWVITPDKIWWKTADGTLQDVRACFAAFDIPNVTDAMMKIIEYALKLAEESTSIPLITQGQTGPTSPDTYGAAQLQDSNANQLLRSIGYAFDDYITEPVVRQFYEWLLLDPAVPDEEKGDFTIDAHGSIALVERAIQDQTVAQMGPMAKDPAFGIDPKKWAKQFLKSKRLQPEDFQYSPEDQAKLDAAPPPLAPAVQAAQIAADAQLKLGVMKQTTEAQGLQSEERVAAAANVLEHGHVDNEAQRVQAEHQRTLADATVKLHDIQMRHDLALLEYANQHQISINQAKVDLAKTAMQLNAQRQLNAADNAVELSKHHQEGRPQRPSRPKKGPQRSTPALENPSAQVPGRAGNGRSFEQGPAQ